jgi:ATP-dependent RNA helicase RhlE
VLVKAPKKENVGPAFHEKKDKNKKVNIKMTRADKMREKYSKPKKRPQKK